MWDVRACRGCLTVKCKLEKIGEASKRLYTTLTGLQMQDGDGYPNYFCVECRTQLRKCLAFRRKSRRAHFVLKEIMTVRKQVTYSDIVTVNRRKTNLESSLKYWDPQKSSYLIINADEDSSTELKPDVPQSSNHTSIVDIQPVLTTQEFYVPIDTFEDAVEDSIPDQIDTEISEEENAAKNIEDIPADIDLNDIFKDLNDDNSISDTEEMPEEVDTAVKETEIKDVLERKLTVNTSLTALMGCTIRALSLKEQVKLIEVKKKQEPFYHAQFKCSMCFTTYKTMELLVEHVNFHNDRRFDIECKVCKNKFETVEQLNLHKARSHTYEYKCRCEDLFYSLYDLVDHHKKCCPQDARRKAFLSRLRMFEKVPLTDSMMREIAEIRVADPFSQQEKPDTPNAMQCDVCGMWTSSVAEMVTHITHKHDNSYTCKECGEVFTQRSHAMKHAGTHLEKTMHICDICGKKYTSNTHLALHRSKRHDEPVPCNLCGHAFPAHASLYRHQLSKHKYISLNDPLVGDPQLACGTCGVQFVRRAALETHLVLEAHAGAADVPFSCVPCKKLYQNQEGLETHLITCKQPIKYPRKCCYCEEMLYDKMQYQRHYNVEHPTLQYRYAGMNTICELCGKSVYKPNLEAHLKSHSVAAYQCRYCDTGSPNATVHVNHVLSQHAARPFCCTLCTRRFQHRSDCRDHILKVHAPAKLYRCEFCGMEFSYYPRLKKHSEKLHNLRLPLLRLPKVTKLKVAVYAHLVIEINVLEKPAVEKCKVEMLDYLGQKSKPVNYEDFFKFTSNPDEYIAKAQKRIRTQKTNAKNKAKKVKIESDVIIKVKDEINLDGNDFKTIKKFETETYDFGSEVENAVREIQEPMKVEVVQEMEQENVEQEVQEVEQVEMEQEPIDQMLIDEERPLEVFEDDGYQYVMICGEMYRLATDGDE